ncbi:MAG: 2-hydroxyacid dehydrogenase [Deltaproteobacteria bacterium]|nr:2-hydroxyacid dehydrogenase [Deltaproteobacteria bacterium]
MKVLVFDVHAFEEKLLREALKDFEARLVSVKLDESTVGLAKGYEAVVVFIHDHGSSVVLERLKAGGTQLIITRSAGFNHIDLEAAKRLGLQVANVPKYSPYAVAEHAVALILALNRKLIRAHHRMMDLNFSLNGLIGFDLHGKTVGVLGVGKIGKVFAQIMRGFGCRVLAYDLQQEEAWAKKHGVSYASLEEIYQSSHIISLHLPLNEATKYLIDESALSKMKKGVMLINTGRGALIKTQAAIAAIKSGKLGFLGLDVYEEEETLFFEDHSEDILQDDIIARLLTFPNVLITSHQAFLTQEALENIVSTTLENLIAFQSKKACPHAL